MSFVLLRRTDSKMSWQNSFFREWCKNIVWKYIRRIFWWCANRFLGSVCSKVHNFNTASPHHGHHRLLYILCFWDRNPDFRKEAGNTQKNTTKASVFFRNCWELRNSSRPTLLILCSAWLMLCGMHGGHLVLVDVSRMIQILYRKSGIWNLGSSRWTETLELMLIFLRLF